MKALSLPIRPLKIAIVQNNAGDNVVGNLRRFEKMIARIPACDLVALPEVFALRGNHGDYRANAQSMQGHVVQWLKHIACAHSSWVLAGSIIEKEDTKNPAGSEALALPRTTSIIGRIAASLPRRPKFFNTCLLLDRRGKIAAKYRKIHLFEAHLDNGQSVREKDIYEAGNRPVMVNIEGWNCGLAICYDLRFPELFRYYSARGAHLFFVPANFTQQTGKDHWETLLRARAIENQSFVVAPDQCGANPKTGIPSYGNSMIVGPWGGIIARAGKRECVLTAELDPDELSRTRARIPVLCHRRIGHLRH